MQARRLEKLLAYAGTQVPFYQRRVQSKAGPGLRDFPVLTKNDIRENFEDLMSPQVRQERRAAKRGRGYAWLEVRPGGSDGRPTTVIPHRELLQFREQRRLHR